ncbi:FtsW/RodA/SpoVE family cell cycle protein [Anaerospora hongkongensis]|uniref:FtsW/RodA/SpoVE family cell cycle protein n=1 Tax=Anaerospora hongkongensis TaxID=244830 RepID=UPI00289D8BFF|nr:putative peptidoglycan glycosyltransferase FtsW [Anaerospora hongkongensis]
MPALWSNPAQAVLYLILILFALGTVNIFSASFVTASREWNDSYFYLKRHLQAFGIGLVLLWLAAKFDYRQYKWFVPVMILGTMVTLALVPVMGLEANGARRWLKLGMTFQPSELAKLASVMMTAAYLGVYLDRGRRTSILSWPFWLTGMMVVLVYKQPDMGTAVVIFALCMVVYLLSGIPRYEWLSLVGIGAIVVVASVYAAPYRVVRIAAWFNPWEYQQDIGYQAVQALLAIGSGGFMGTGLGLGASKFFYLPEAHTDFAFAVLSQEMGFIGVLFVLFLFAAVTWYGTKIAIKAPDGYGMLLAGGITALLSGQAVGNVAMVCGILPVTGVPLPFISFGGTSLIVNMLAVGILISIGRQATAEGDRPSRPEPQLDPKRRARRRLELVNRK